MSDIHTASKKYPPVPDDFESLRRHLLMDHDYTIPDYDIKGGLTLEALQERHRRKHHNLNQEYARMLIIDGGWEPEDAYQEAEDISPQGKMDSHHTHSASKKLPDRPDDPETLRRHLLVDHQPSLFEKDLNVINSNPSLRVLQEIHDDQHDDADAELISELMRQGWEAIDAIDHVDFHSHQKVVDDHHTHTSKTIPTPENRDSLERHLRLEHNADAYQRSFWDEDSDSYLFQSHEDEHNFFGDPGTGILDSSKNLNTPKFIPHKHAHKTIPLPGNLEQLIRHFNTEHGFTNAGRDSGTGLGYLLDQHKYIHDHWDFYDGETGSDYSFYHKHPDKTAHKVLPESLEVEPLRRHLWLDHYVGWDDDHFVPLPTLQTIHKNDHGAAEEAGLQHEHNTKEAHQTPKLPPITSHSQYVRHMMMEHGFFESEDPDEMLKYFQDNKDHWKIDHTLTHADQDYPLNFGGDPVHEHAEEE